MFQKKEIKIFLNSMNSWFSNFLIEELRTDYLPKSKIQYSFMGTLDDSGRPLPYLFEPKITKIEIGYNYDQEIFDNDIYILNLNDSNLEEAEFIIRGLKTLKFFNRKMLIIISNIMTWANTPLKYYTEEEIEKYNLKDEEEIPETITEKIKNNNIIESEDNNIDITNSEIGEDNFENEIKEVINQPKIDYNKIKSTKNMKEQIKEIKEENEEENELNEESDKNNEKDISQIKSVEEQEINDNINTKRKDIKKIYYFKEEDYPKRIPNSLYYNFKIIETMALQIDNSNLKTYIVCPGFIYGCGEDFFFDYFKKSWLGGIDYFPIRGNGYNYIPTIHILDLIQVIKRIIDFIPHKQYIFAFDRTKEPFLKNILGAITKKIGGINIKPIKEYNIDEMEIINYSELKINLPMKTSSIINDEKRQMGESISEYNKRIFQWHCEGGIEANINLLINEFKLYRDIRPIRIIINGPPSGGKMTIAKILSEKYKLSIFNLKNICEWAENLGENDPLGKEMKQKKEEIEENIKKALEEFEHRKNKRKSDPPLDTNSFRKFSPDFIKQLVRERISRDECLFKGYILVNYPKNYRECINLFSVDPPKEIKNEENNENKENKEIKENKDSKEHKDNKHNKDKKEEEKEINEELEEKREIIKDLLPDNVIIINNYTEESLKGKLQKNVEYNEKQQEIDARFNRRLEKYKKDNESQEPGQKKILEDFYKENNVNIYYIDESKYMENKELSEKELIDNLQNNGLVDNYSKLFDEEDEIVYLKPIIKEETEIDMNQNIINLDEEENIQNNNNIVPGEDKNQQNNNNEENKENKKNIEIIKEDESEESMVRIQKNAKKKNEHNISKLKLKRVKEKKNLEKEKKEKNSKESIEKEKENNGNSPTPKRNSIDDKDLIKNRVEKTIEEQLNELKEREQKLLEKKSEVLRRYLSENIMPLLAKGVLYVCHNLPDDPVEALANYLLENSFDLQKDLDNRPIGELEKIMQETEH